MSMLLLLFGVGSGSPRRHAEGTVVGGTFSKKRWRTIVGEIEAREERRLEALRNVEIKKLADQNRQRNAAAKARRDAREAAKAEGDAKARALAVAHAEANRAGMDMLRQVAHAAALQARAGTAAAHAHDEEDDEIALLMLMAHQ